MTGRNRAFASAGLWKLGDGLDAVLKLLPAERRDAISRHLEIERGRDDRSLTVAARKEPSRDREEAISGESDARGARLRATREKEQLRIEKIAGAAGDPRLRRWLIDRLVGRTPGPRPTPSSACSAGPGGPARTGESALQWN